jgi:hypothetical protein
MRTWTLSLLAWLTVGLAGCARNAAVQAEPEAVVAKPAPRPQVVVVAQKPAAPEKEPPAPEPFAFPADQGGKLLERALKPADPPPLPAAPAEPRPRPVPSAIARPEPPLPSSPAELARLPVGPPASVARPRPLPDEPPLTSRRDDPTPPERCPLPATAGVRLPSVDVTRPPALPPLAQPLPDREPLTDPTAFASRQAALAAPAPSRSAPAPFVREGLPDPFENVHPVRLRTPPPEDGSPYVAQPRLPRP